MLELNRRVQADLPLSAAERSAWRQWIGIAPAAFSSSSAGKRRKRKKRRKRRTPRTSSCPRGRARRRQRRWLLHGCSVFPSVDDWPQMLGIMAGLDQKDSLPRGRCCACCRHWQWHVRGWFSWLCFSRCVLSSMLDILAHMDQRDSYAALVVVTAVVCAWLFFLVTMLSRCVLFDCRQARVARHHGALGESCSLPVCATTGLMVQTVQIYVLEQFLDKVVTRPLRPWSLHRCISWTRLLSSPQCRGPDSEKTVWFFRSCSSLMVVDIPFVTQRPIPMVQRWTIEFSQLQFALGGRCPCYAVVKFSSTAAVHQCGRQLPCRCAEFFPWSRQFVRPGFPSCWSTSLFQVVQVHFPVVAQWLFPMVQTARRTIETSQLQYASDG